MKSLFAYITMTQWKRSKNLKHMQTLSEVLLSILLLPHLLSCSDDKVIKLWDWEKDWACTQIFEGDSHYVMQAAFNPKDANTFTTSSLGGTIKIWNIGSPDPEFTLEGHLKGVNCIDYFIQGDKPCLLSGSDDFTVKVWDYETKSCGQTLGGHEHNVTAVGIHPELPILIKASEEGNVHVWHATTFRCFIAVFWTVWLLLPLLLSNRNPRFLRRSQRNQMRRTKSPSLFNSHPNQMQILVSLPRTDPTNPHPHTPPKNRLGTLSFSKETRETK